VTPAELREDVGIELEALEAIVQELLSLQADVVNRDPTVREQTAAAAFLAQFYNGVENILKRELPALEDRAPHALAPGPALVEMCAFHRASAEMFHHLSNNKYCAFYVVVLWFSLPLEKEHSMNVSIGERWELFVDQAVKAGRYSSASEVVREGLRLVEEREAKLTALRAIIDASITAGGQVTDEQLDDALARQSNELLRQGIGA
jgi:antitoxin ParD1/3/4